MVHQGLFSEIRPKTCISDLTVNLESPIFLIQIYESFGPHITLLLHKNCPQINFSLNSKIKLLIFHLLSKNYKKTSLSLYRSSNTPNIYPQKLGFSGSVQYLFYNFPDKYFKLALRCKVSTIVNSPVI